MDTPLNDEKLSEERAFMKRYSEGLASHKVEYPSDFSTPLEDRPRKVPVVGLALADLPDDEDMEVDAAGHDQTITITVKSLKPSLTLPITISPTEPITTLKALISKASPSAPPPESQRLLLKGKALTDSKLLKEYEIADGAVVHLMLKPAAAATGGEKDKSTAVADPVPSTSKSTTATAPPPSPKPNMPAPPSLTITTSVDDDSKPGTSIPLTNIDIAAPPLGPGPEVTSATFHRTVSDPVFWQKIHALCVSEFAYEDEGDSCWETFLRSMKGKLSAGEAAKIRDVVGIRGMGGGA